VNLPKKTVFWIITLVALAGGFYLIDERVEDSHKVTEAGLRLFPFEPSDIQAFWISSRDDGMRVRLERQDESWWLTQPLHVRADEQVLQDLLTNIVKARKDAVLFEDPQPDKLEELGLATPELEMGFETSAGTTVIQFGNKGPTNNIAYARFRGDARVYRIHSDVKEEADRRVYDLRDRTILDFDPLKINRFELQRADRDDIIIEHDNGRWNMLQPHRTRAAMEKVLEALYQIKNAQIKAFIADKPVDHGDYGFDVPRIKLVIGMQDNSPEHLLLIGARDRKQRGYFAAIDASEAVFLVEETMVNALLVDASAWEE